MGRPGSRRCSCEGTGTCRRRCSTRAWPSRRARAATRARSIRRRRRGSARADRLGLGRPAARFERLRGALQIAARRARRRSSSAGQRLAAAPAGRARRRAWPPSCTTRWSCSTSTAAERARGCRSAIADAPAQRATSAAPLYWLRMEPERPAARDVRAADHLAGWRGAAARHRRCPRLPCAGTPLIAAAPAVATATRLGSHDRRRRTSADPRRRHRLRVVACAASCMGCPASTRWAPRRGPRCSPRGRSRRDAKLWALDMAIRMTDLTTLEGADTPGKVRALCAKAMRPDPTDPDGAVGRGGLRLSRTWSPSRVEALAGSDVAVASVATAFPSRPGVTDARGSTDVARGGRCRRGRDRHGHRPGRVPRRVATPQVLDDDRRGQSSRAATRTSRSSSRPASSRRWTTRAGRRGWRCSAGADFIKTSTGKVAPASHAADRPGDARGGPRLRSSDRHAVGVKAAGGIRSAKDAIRYLVLVNETAGPTWLTPDRFRFGASSLLNDLLHAAHQAAHRPLRRPRLLHAGLTPMS